MQLRNLFASCLFAVIAMPAVAIQPAPAATPAAATPLSVSASDGVVADTPGLASFDFGKATTGQTIQHDFTLSNTTNASVEIARVQAACGCTSVMVDGSSNTSGKSIAPNASVTLHVSIDPTYLSAGPVDKEVWVFVPGHPRPAVTLHMTGLMLAATTVDPTVLDFGTVRWGQGTSRTITVTTNRKAFHGKVPTPTCANPDLTIKPVATPDPNPDPDTDVRSYTVVLSNRPHLGDLQSTIDIPDPQGTGVTSIFVHGAVTGVFICEPPSVAFGACTHGTTIVQQVKLTGEGPKSLFGMSVVTQDVSLRARIIPGDSIQVTPSTGLPTAVLEVTFTPKTTGAFQSDIILTSQNGETLSIPAWAYVN